MGMPWPLFPVCSIYHQGYKYGGVGVVDSNDTVMGLANRARDHHRLVIPIHGLDWSDQWVLQVCTLENMITR